MAERTTVGDGLRIEELSRLSDVSVRNIRQYQDRGLLPAPRREGRIAFYDAEHVVRLRLISRLLARGYTLAVIRDLLNAWANGRDLHDVLGLETAVSPLDADDAEFFTRDELAARFGGRLTDDVLGRLVERGVVVPEGPIFRSPRPRLLAALAVLLAAGVEAQVGLDLAARTRRHLDDVAEDMVSTIAAALFPEGMPDGLPTGPELEVLVGNVKRLRGVAGDVTDALFAQALTAAVNRAVDLIARRALAEQQRRADELA